MSNEINLITEGSDFSQNLRELSNNLRMVSSGTPSQNLIETENSKVIVSSSNDFLDSIEMS